MQIKDMMRHFMVRNLAVAALALVLILGAGLWLARPGDPATGQTAFAPFAVAAQEAATAPLPEVPELVLGAADAPVTVVEYASYTCPHCATFHDAVFKSLKTDYIDTGKVRFVYREVYFDRYGLWAAMVARCGGETRYFGISSMLFEQQREWAASDDPAVVVENLKKIGRTAGLDDATLDACLKDNAMAQALVATYQQNATADAVEGTPTLIINGQKHGNMSYDDLVKILDEKLGG
jgi:protein-disulfide isomerase